MYDLSIKKSSNILSNLPVPLGHDYMCYFRIGKDAMFFLIVQEKMFFYSEKFK